MHLRTILAGCIGLAGLLSFSLSGQTSPLATRFFPLDSAPRQALMQEYALIHYGQASAVLESPWMITVHFTATTTLAETLAVFRPVRLAGSRPDIAAGGEANVSIHYVIDADGTVWSLLPENLMARHVIGFNQCSIGIELVAKNEQALTPAQLASCVGLVADIAARHPQIRYLVGHHEYMQKSLPHFILFKELDKNYAPTVKTDPGARFMAELRQRLAGRMDRELLP